MLYIPTEAWFEFSGTTVEEMATWHQTPHDDYYDEPEFSAEKNAIFRVMESIPYVFAMGFEYDNGEPDVNLSCVAFGLEGVTHLNAIQTRLQALMETVPFLDTEMQRTEIYQCQNNGAVEFLEDDALYPVWNMFYSGSEALSDDYDAIGKAFAQLLLQAIQEYVQELKSPSPAVINGGIKVS